MSTTPHYIGMAGLSGYLPQYCGVYTTAGEAAESLGEMHNLGRERRRVLRSAGYLSLNLHRDGNEYCEIVSCVCGNPERHSDY